MVNRKVTSLNGRPKGVVKLIRGSCEKQEDVWKFLKDMGASNEKGFNFDGEDMYYYIDVFGEVDYLEKVEALKLLNEGKCELCELPNDTKESQEESVSTNGKTMIPIDAACKWIYEHCHDYIDRKGYMGTYFFKKGNFVSDFRNVMEGEFGNNYKMVDLGLPSGILWCDRNVGASSPEDYGDYFMLGNVTPDTDKTCEWSHAPFNNGQVYFDEEHFNSHKSDWFDGDVLKPKYDAAHVSMGGSWRMPTEDEIHELLEWTTQSVETIGDVKGMLFTAPNGNSIFMPFCGFRNCYEVYDDDIYGYVWSSSLRSDNYRYSRYLYFSDKGQAYVNSYSRCVGFVVRGVHE